MAFERFLVPIDFSEYAERALDYAIDLAKQLGARLTLLHVVSAHIMPELPLTIDETTETVPEGYMRELEKRAQQGLEQYLKRAQDAGVTGDVVVVHGIPFQSIIDTAKDRNADLIVMGTHGRTGLKHVLLGSVAEKVVRFAPCPVLVTRQMPSAA